MCVCVGVCVCVCVHARARVFVCVFVCERIDLYLSVCECTYTFEHSLILSHNVCTCWYCEYINV